jgi:hypothetical protein
MARDQSRKGVFLYFHVFLCGNEFLGPKKGEKSLNRVKKCFPSNGSTFKMGHFTFVSSSYQKTEPKIPFSEKNYKSLKIESGIMKYGILC